MPNVINKLVVKELSDAFSDAEGMVMATMQGLTVAETEELRGSLAEKGVRLRMVRNRLAKLALAERGLEAPAGLLKGNIACAWGGVEDTINAAKVLEKSPAKKAGKVSIQGGLFEGNLLDASEAKALADLPGKDELRGMMLSALIGPARGLVGLLAAPGGSLARVVQAKIDRDGGGDA